MQKSTELKKELVAIPLGKPFIGMKAGVETLNAISKTAKNPERAIKVIELLNTDKDIHNLISFGIEGTHYTKVSNNVVELQKEPTFAGVSWEFGNTFNDFLMKGQDLEKTSKIVEVNNTATKSKIMGFVPDMEPIKNEIALVEAADKEFRSMEFLNLNDDNKYLEMKQKQLDKMNKAGYKKVTEEVSKTGGCLCSTIRIKEDAWYNIMHLLLLLTAFKFWSVILSM